MSPASPSGTLQSVKVVFKPSDSTSLFEGQQGPMAKTLSPRLYRIAKLMDIALNRTSTGFPEEHPGFR